MSPAPDPLPASRLVPLSQLPIGASGRVREFSSTGAAFLRLREMGLIVGTPLTLVRAAPLGDPLEIKVRGYLLTLRRSEAAHVLVETDPTLLHSGA